MNLNSIVSFIKKEKLDAFLVSKSENIFYLSGFTGSFGQILVTPKKSYLITDSRYIIRAEKELKAHLKSQLEIIDVYKVKPIMEKCRYIGFEKQDLTVARLERLQKIYPNGVFRGIDSLIEDMRIVKTDEEVKYIRKAAKITDTILKKLKKKFVLGVSEIDMVWELKTLIYEAGCEGPSFPPIIAFGVNSAIAHHEPSSKKLKKGDTILVDFGVIYKKYCSDMTRMLYAGSINEKQKVIYDAVLNAQLKALHAVRPNIKSSVLDAVARDCLKEDGLADKFGHSLGHGVGVEIHEEPGVAPRSETVLKPGMVITIEPGVYIKNFGGVRIEDLVLVTKNGYETLSHSSKKIEIIPI